jgi:hypothetical protein
MPRNLTHRVFRDPERIPQLQAGLRVDLQQRLGVRLGQPAGPVERRLQPERPRLDVLVGAVLVGDALALPRVQLVLDGQALGGLPAGEPQLADAENGGAEGVVERLRVACESTKTVVENCASRKLFESTAEAYLVMLRKAAPRG